MAYPTHDPWQQPDPYSSPPAPVVPGSPPPYMQSPPGPYPPPTYPQAVYPQPAPGMPTNQYPPQPMVIVAPSRPTSGMAVAAMVLGIVGLVFGCCTFGVPNLLAIGLGHAAYAATKNEQVAGKGMAVAGLVMGYVMVVPIVLFIVLGGLGAVVGEISPQPTPTP